LITGASTARADAPCDAGFRDSTAAERAQMTAILQAAKNALPSAPAGWQIGGYEVISVAGSVCRDVENRPWNYGISRQYDRIDDYEARQKEFQDAAALAAAEQKKKQPRLDAVMAKMQKLSEQQIALVQNSDMAGAEKSNYEMAKLQEEYGKIAAEGDSEAQIAAAGKKMNRDIGISISVQVNPTSGSQDAGARSFALPPGAVAALRWDETGDPNNADQGHALVLFGKWTRTKDVTWRPSLRPNAAPTAAHVISVKVMADPTRIDSVLQAIDFKSLATALAK
jgi:hypothetical protein